MKRPVAVRVVGPMHWIVIPSLIAIGLTIVLATPIQLFGLHLPEPVAPMVLAFAWPLIRPSMIAAVVLFALGLFLDLLWGGVMGVWPLALMSVYALVLLSRNLLAGQEGQIHMVWYGCCTLMAFLLAYLVVGFAAGNAPSVFGLLGQVIPTLALWPAAAWMIERFDDGDVRFR
jgi:rod shape-determining protein MreD